LGAITSNSVTLLNSALIEALQISKGQLASIIRSEFKELRRRAVLYRQSKPTLVGADPAVAGRTVLELVHNRVFDTWE
jgi:predicted phosphoribosyltransferase